MKDIKTFVIGFLTCCCLFLVMGQTKSDNQNGRYQGWAGEGNDGYLLDTTTGELYLRQIMTKKDKKIGNNADYFWKWVKMGQTPKKSPSEKD